MRFQISILVLLMFTFHSYTSAQSVFKEAYIVTIENDTIFGRVDLRSYTSLCKVCVFKRNIETESTEYSPAQLKAYHFIGGRYFISKNLDFEEGTEKVFIELLVDEIKP